MMTARIMTGIAAMRTRAPGLPTALVRKLGGENRLMVILATACSTRPGLAPRGHWATQSLHWWQSHTSGSPMSLFLSPHWAHIISLRGNGLSSGVRLHTTEQVAHW